MKNPRFIPSFFVGFLALFLSLGPSLHRAQLFHLHAEVGGEPAPCCCHSCPKISDSVDNDTLIGIDLGNSDSSCCAICDFFKKYKSTELVQDLQLESERIEFVEPPFHLALTAESISFTARGPPTL